ncbi:MAG: rRNA pseudouridine synthase [Candidatus Dormibacteraeota bacterium]|nr:rRNA pseudouridine synthase [Candidatus Dormibacteraeota bacterium]
MIANGQVSVNGRPATPGQEVQPDVDEVTVAGTLVRLVTEATYLILNKPVGVVTSVGDPRGRPSVVDGLPPGGARVYPVGRLDLDSRGLVLLTDDGDLAARLMHPRYDVEKEYRVVISGHPEAGALRRLREGMVINGEDYAPVDVRILELGESRSLVAMILHEGKNREIRRLWRALGHRVLDLQRVRMDGLRLGDLAEGAVRRLHPDEVLRLRAAAGLP